MADIVPLHLIGGKIHRAKAGDVIATEHGGTGSSTLEELKSNLDLENVDNTSDVDKPVSTAAANALASKADLNHTHQFSAIEEILSPTQGNIAILDNEGRLFVPASGVSGDFVLAYTTARDSV